jgi:hypothetical protein
MAVEDQRAAVGFSITLSGQLIAAATATLAVECAYVSFALGAHDVPYYFFVFAVSGAILIILSIISGGRGITIARNAGFAANWDLNKGKGEFNVQALCLAGALVLLGVGFFLVGPLKRPHVEQKLDTLCKETELVRKELELHRTLNLVAKGIEERLGDITAELQKLRPSPTPQAIKRPRHR